MKWTAQEDEVLRSMYRDSTRNEIAAALNRTEGMVRARCWTLGLAEKVQPWSQSDVDELKRAYAVNRPACEIGLDELAKKFGRHKSNVSRKARALGLTNQHRPMVRPEDLKKKLPKFDSKEARSAHMSISRKEWHRNNQHPRGALGMKHTEAAKKVIAQKSQERWDSMTQEERDAHIFKTVKAKRDMGISFTNPRGSWKAAWREVGPQRCFFRSRWEANYARYLQWLISVKQIQSWEHEAHTFWFEGIKRGVVSYLPDFKVTNVDGSVEWHEVKGWMDSRSKTTIARMAKYHPNEKLVVIQEKQYNEIKRKVSSLIPGWES